MTENELTKEQRQFLQVCQFWTRDQQMVRLTALRQSTFYNILSKRIVAWCVLFVATCMAGSVTMAVLNSHVRTSTTTVSSQVTTSAAPTNSTSTKIITQTTITTPTNSTSITSATMSTTIPTTTTFAMLLLSTYIDRNKFKLWFDWATSKKKKHSRHQCRMDLGT